MPEGAADLTSRKSPTVEGPLFRMSTDWLSGAARCGVSWQSMIVTSTPSSPIVDVVWMQREAEVDGAVGANMYVKWDKDIDVSLSFPLRPVGSNPSKAGKVLGFMYLHEVAYESSRARAQCAELSGAVWLL